jgi:hypothetical protein
MSDLKSLLENFDPGEPIGEVESMRKTKDGFEIKIKKVGSPPAEPTDDVSAYKKIDDVYDKHFKPLGMKVESVAGTPVQAPVWIPKMTRKTHPLDGLHCQVCQHDDEEGDWLGAWGEEGDVVIKCKNCGSTVHIGEGWAKSDEEGSYEPVSEEDIEQLQQNTPHQFTAQGVFPSGYLKGVKFHLELELTPPSND